MKWLGIALMVIGILEELKAADQDGKDRLGQVNTAANLVLDTVVVKKPELQAVKDANLIERILNLFKD